MCFNEFPKVLVPGIPYLNSSVIIPVLRMSIHLLICDLDGTLVDSFRDIVTSSNLLLASCDAAPLTDQEIGPCIGRGVRFLVEGICAAAGIDAGDIDEKVGRYREIYRAHAMDETRLYPGVRETLEVLRTWSDGALHLAVVSNKPETASHGILSALGVDRYFRVVAGGDSFAEMKPSPLPLKKIMEAEGAAPAETAMVGDSVYDIQAGKGAGVRTIAALYGFQPAEMLKALEPDYTVSAFDEVLTVLGVPRNRS